MELIGDNKLTHWGSYDAVDHGFDSRTRSPLGQAALQTVSLPGMAPPADLSQLVAPEVRGRLQYVRSDLQPLLLNALAPTEFVPSGGAHPGYQPGTIKPSFGTAGPAWYHQAVNNGGAVLVNLASIQTAQPIFYLASDSLLIANNAYVGGPVVIVAIAPALEAQAQSQVGMVAEPPPLPGPPPPVPGGPPPQASAIPWGTVAIGGVLLVGAVVLISRSR